MACVSTTQPNETTKDHKSSFLLSLMGKSIIVKIIDGRSFHGLLMCTDNCGNIAMRDVLEYQPDDGEPYTKLKSGHNVRLIFCVVSLYWVVSISLVFINKWLLSNSDTLLDAPMFVTCFQCFIAVLLCAILAKISSKIPDKFSFPSLDFSMRTSLRIMPLSCVFFLMILFNNLCLKYLDIAFYFVARSLTTVFNVILTYLILRKTTSWKAILCCGIIISGYVISVIQENGLGTLSLSGLFYGLSASFAVSLFSILTSKGLVHVNGSVWRLTFYNNMNSFCLFIVGIAVSGEWKELHYLPTSLSSIGMFFWFIMLLSGVFGFAISYVTTWQIQVTSPLTHNISGTAKAAVQTIIATLISMRLRSFLWWLGNGMVVGGSMAYAYVRHKLAVKDQDQSHQSLPTHSNSSDREPLNVVIDEHSLDTENLLKKI